MTEEAQDALQRVGGVAVVVGHHDAHLPRSRRGARVGEPDRRAARERQAHDELRSASASRAARLDAAAVQMHDALREPQPHARRLLEEARSRRGLEAHAAVLY